MRFVFGFMLVACVFLMGTQVVMASDGREVLTQCSRSVPDKKFISDYWIPKAQDIDQLERDLQDYVIAEPQFEAIRFDNDMNVLDDFDRIYVGIVYHDELVIYIDFRPRGFGHGVVCDGGSQFFGVEYYPEKHLFKNWHFNGLL